LGSKHNFSCKNHAFCSLNSVTNDNSIKENRHIPFIVLIVLKEKIQ
jgi:hypothetical protein